jgi:hypothetical protein
MFTVNSLSEITKRCNKCDIDMPISEFGVDNSKTTKLSSHCKKCERNNQLKYKFGITLIKYQQLLESQKSCCAICRQPFVGSHNKKTAPVVDHNHTTNEVRGLLCNGCNRGVGQFKDDVQILKLFQE